MAVFSLCLKKALIGILGLGLWAGIVSLQNWQQIKEQDRAFREGRLSLQGIEKMLLSTKQWALERGKVNYLLKKKEPVSVKNNHEVMAHRHLSEEAFREVQNQVKTFRFSQNEIFIKKYQQVEADYTHLLSLREEADTQLSMDISQRQPDFPENWIEDVSHLIVNVQDLGEFILRMQGEEIPSLRHLQEVIYFSWIITEYGGRERARIASLLEAKRSLTPLEMNLLGKFRGQVEMSQGQLSQEMPFLSPMLRQTLETVDEKFFQEFEGVRRRVYSAGEDGTLSMMKAEEWFEKSTQALESVFEIQEVAIDEMYQHIDAQQEGLKSRLRGVVFQGVVCLFLLMIGLWGIGGMSRAATKKA